MDISQLFFGLTDPRSPRKKTYSFVAMMTMSLCAMMAGETSFTGIADYAENNYEVLKKHVELPDSTPDHETFRLFYDGLNPDEFNKWFYEFTQNVAQYCDQDIEEETEKRQLALDGKTIRNSTPNTLLHIVHVWCAKNKLVLMQKKVEDKSNEIKAIPVLLQMLDLEGVVITMDAMGAQRDICAQIIDRGGDYVIGLKGNQKSLNEDARDYFKLGENFDFSSFTNYDKGHGRIEKRTCRVTDKLAWLNAEHHWPGLKTIVEITSEITHVKKKKTTEEKRYYLTSLSPNPEKISKYIRDHWQSENNLHWVLDCTFNEDKGGIRRENAALNISTARKLILNVFSAFKDPKISIRSMQRKCQNPTKAIQFLLKFVH
jgi:predicted transposase YbfD/YdcC